MKLKTKARYALRTMIEISLACGDGQPVSLERVAQRTSISKRYLGHLAVALRDAALLRGVRGRTGGYLLARPPQEIMVGEIIEAVIGPINIVDCVQRPELCLIADVCECRLVYAAINTRITGALNAFSLADLTQWGRLREKDIEDITRSLDHQALTPGKDPSIPRGSPCTTS